ncbi:hypothetical protein LRD18_10430 [Halorhodospira halochloris]|uniref:hypothetical protein n=1 Tax=Halorhodospira halochloris TaxID=1052 RepID=UPI001EE8A5A8|nr:hypothetical protein [Halorhodospira halochloris]MCG5531271.1 hypothetical protein [Halorhodospira halochloris]
MHEPNSEATQEFWRTTTLPPQIQPLSLLGELIALLMNILRECLGEECLDAAWASLIDHP